MTHFFTHNGLPLLFVVVMLESFGIPLPGETALIFFGVLASKGHYNIAWVIAITAAAAIMIVVFGAFVLNYSPEIKMFGLGLAFAVLVDATIVRMMLVPSIMEILGDANWWFPKWLDRIVPRLHVEPAVDVDAEVASLLREQEAHTP